MSTKETLWTTLLWVPFSILTNLSTSVSRHIWGMMIEYHHMLLSPPCHNSLLNYLDEKPPVTKLELFSANFWEQVFKSLFSVIFPHRANSPLKQMENITIWSFKPGFKVGYPDSTKFRGVRGKCVHQECMC